MANGWKVAALVLAMSAGGCGDDEGGTGGAGGATGTQGSGGDPAGSGGAGASGAEGGSGSGGEPAGGAGSGGELSERRVFVTSQTYTGALGGVAGADEACQTLAGAASLGGSWKAWVGDGVNAPEATFVKSTVRYVLVGGGMVAADWADLTDAMLSAAIDHDESGTAVDPGGNTHVWTGASTTGSPLPYHCEGWTSEEPGFTPRGLCTSTDSTWVMSGPDPCATANRIYCFEQ